MIGRGLIGNPFLAKEILTGSHLTSNELKAYVDRLTETYRPLCPGDTVLLNKMKEFWFYISGNFEDSHKVCKLVRKCQTFEKYNMVVDQIFNKYY